MGGGGGGGGGGGLIFGAIIESVRHVYFGKNSNFYYGDLKTKWRMFFVGVKEEKKKKKKYIYIYIYIY